MDVHELGTLIRSVGCCPSETELQEMVTQLEEEGQPGFIRLQTVMPYIIQCVEDRKYPSASTQQLLQAFQVGRRMHVRTCKCITSLACVKLLSNGSLATHQI